jgi:hypothetical protein
MKTIAFASAALVALAALPAFAQAPVGPAAAGRAVTRADVQSRVEARFARADSDRDGFVTRDEVQARRGEPGGRFAARQGGGRDALFARLDSNRDGVLSREEFSAPRAGLAHGRRAGPSFGRGGATGGGFRGRAFAMLDSNRDGRVSLREAEAGALRLFDRIDANRDGTVTPDERRAARQAFRAQRRG